MSLVFRDKDGDRIGGRDFSILVLVGVTNFIIKGYFAMLLFGALHSAAASIPAFGIWTSLGAVMLVEILTFNNGPITWKAPR